MMKKSQKVLRSKAMLMAALICGTICLAPGGAVVVHAEGAEEDGIRSFALDQIVVTATRTEKAIKDTPANVQVITSDDLKNGAYHSVFEAVKNVSQANNHTYMEDGGDYGSMISRVRMRGIDEATLVMINGNPSNFNGYSTLNTIPMDQIEKIEVVKGANSVLYGPQAMGGVINIITKRPGEGSKKVSGNVYGSTGSYNREAGVNVQTDIVNFGVKQNWGKDFNQAVYPGSTGGGTNLNIVDKKSNQVYLDAKITKDLYFSYGRMQNESVFEAGTFKNFVPNITKGTKYRQKYNNYSLSYDNKDNGWKAVAGYSRVKWESLPLSGYSGKPNSYSSNAGYNTNIDVQKKINLAGGRDSLVLGGNFFQEYMNIHSKTYGGFKDQKRKSYSLYQSYDFNPSDRWEFIVGLREYWVDSTQFEDGDFQVLPQVQGIYKASKNANYYFNIGKSFQTTAMTSYFYNAATGSIAVNPDLKPQEGWSYEIGYKYEDDNRAFSADVFHMDVKNKFAWEKNEDGQSYRVNKDKWKNTGLELNYKQKFNDAWTASIGFTMQDPVSKSDGIELQDSSKYILNLGTDYHKGKFDVGARLFSYFGREFAYYDKAHAKSRVYDHKLKSSLDLTMTLSYRPTSLDTFRITGRNLLDRDDVLNSYEYAVHPASVTFTYERSF